MKCPNCGFEIQDGLLMCEQCGHEVRIVPDYDPGTEIQIDDALIEKANDEGLDTDEDPLLTDTITDETFDLNSIRNRAVATAIFIITTILVIVGVVLLVLKTNSYESKINKAKSIAAKGKYENAISELENLYVHNPNESEIFFLEADYYLALERPEMAIDTLMRMLEIEEFSVEEYTKAYDRLIAIYADNENYNAINKLLTDCKYDEIVNAYQNYLAIAPVFSIDGGEYTDVLRLKLSANTTGKIFYTLDGSVPNQTSKAYSGPIVLETGEYKVSAIFINQYGIESEVTTNSYIISAEIPDAPIVNLDTGSYTSPAIIEVVVPKDSTVYYTTDKSTPTIDSIPYTGPIPIPLNTSNFSFITINDQGLCSDVVIRSYKLSFPDGISPDTAANILKNRMIERGMLIDSSGKSNRAPGYYTYAASSAITIMGQGDYYIINEFYHDGSGSIQTSDTTYIVEIYQGSTGILGGDAVNGFIAVSF